MKCGYVFLVIFVSFALPEDIFCADLSEGSQLLSSELVEEGRTFVHHTIKRLAVILPAIFFKLGIAFSLLLLVTIVAVNNGFIGFLLLIVGVSTVLARLQEAKRVLPIPVPALHAPLPLALGHHHHFLDRSDDASSIKEVRTGPSTNIPYAAYAAAPSSPTYAYNSNDNYAGNVYSEGKYYATQ